MFIVLLLTVSIVLIAVLLLGIRVFFTQRGKFPETHIGNNKAMKEKGIHCAQTQDRQERRRKDIFDLSRKKD